MMPRMKTMLFTHNKIILCIGLSLALVSGLFCAPLPQPQLPSATQRPSTTERAPAGVGGSGRDLVLAPASQSPHWPHINVLAFNPGLAFIADETVKSQAQDWLAQRLDVTGWVGDTAVWHSRNPTMRVFTYQYDLTETTPTLRFGPLSESAYLHVSQDTTVSFYSKDNGSFIRTVNIPGNPTGPLKPASRLLGYLWDSERWYLNLNDPAARAAILANLNYNIGQGYGGFFLDEHGPPGYMTLAYNGIYSRSIPANIGFPASNDNLYFTQGGHIREYGGLPLGDPALENHYIADQGRLGAYLRTQLPPGTLLLPNFGSSASNPAVLSVVLGYKGADVEGSADPDWLVNQLFTDFVTFVKTVTDAGGSIDLYGVLEKSAPAFTSSGYPGGVYSSGRARYHMVLLAMYYLLKESVGATGKAYFNPNWRIDSANPTAFQADWNLANQVNVGLPSDATTLLVNGWDPVLSCPIAIYGRHYTGGPHGPVYVLLRNLDQGGGSCTHFGDDSGYTVNLGTPMSQLRDDGTLAAASTSVKIRNVDAAILFGTGSITD